MDLKAAGIEIDPNSTVTDEDRKDEFDAKLRERRGEFTGFYTQGDEATTKAMREINNHRGLSGNAQNMMEEIHAIRDAKMKLGGPTDEQKANAIDVEFPLSRKDVPINLRMFGSHLMGNREPLTEADLNDTDISTIRRAVQRDAEKTGLDQGIIGYGDYGDKPGEFSNFEPETSLLGLIIDSFTDPKMRMETTLGMAKWRRDKDGSIIVEDSYNFNANRETVQKALVEKGRTQLLLDAYAKRGWTGLLNAVGNIVGDTESERGNPVKINLGPMESWSPVFNPSINKDWYKAVEGWFNGLEDQIVAGESLGINQGGSRAVLGIGRMFVQEPLRALRELQDADLTRTPSDSPTGGETVSAVGNMALNTGVLSAVAPAPKGVLRVFGGREVAENLAANSTSPLAQLPKKAMDKAEEMTLAGATDAEVRAATNEILKDSPFGGVHLGDDGKWRIEFSDAASKTNKDFNNAFKNYMIPGETAAYKLEDMFDMPFAKSLGLGDARVRVEVTKANEKLKNFQPTGRHTFEGGRHRITINAQNEEQVRDVLLHEIQHALQKRNGFEYGGSAARDNQYINPVQRRVYEQRLEASQDYNFAKRQNDAMWKEASIDAEKRGVKPAFKAKEWQTVEDMQGGYSFEQFSPHWQEKIAKTEKMLQDEFQKLNADFPWDHSDRFLAYQRLSGEVEARNVQTRKDLTAAQLRKIHPRDTEDVPQKLRHQWSDYGDPAGRLTSDSAGGFYGNKKMTAKDISTEERKLATSIKTNTVRKESLERDLASDRFNKSELERKQKALDKHNARIEELVARLTEVADIKSARSMIPSRVNEVAEPAVTPIQQGVPKTLSEDIGRAPKRRSKLERLREDKESLETVLNLETRVPRLERAKKHLKKVESDLDKITGE